MILYNSLNKIPIITFFEIAETGSISLLSDDYENEKEETEKVWLKFYAEHEARENKSESDKLNKLKDEIWALELDYQYVMGGIFSLGFAMNDELIEGLKKFRFIVNTSSTTAYYDSLEYIQRAASSFVTKINHLKSMLPKEPEESQKAKEKFSIYDVIASYTRIMEYDLDYESLTYIKFYAIQKQVHLKMEAEIKKAQINNK